MTRDGSLTAKIMSFLMISSLTLLAQVCVVHPANVTCTVTRNSNRWLYKITGDDNPACSRFQWTNGKDVPLAHPGGSAAVVLSYDDMHLLLNVCLEDLHRNRDCPKEDDMHFVPCPANCTEDHEVSSHTRGRYGAIISFVLFMLSLCACWCRYRKEDNL